MKTSAPRPGALRRGTVRSALVRSLSAFHTASRRFQEIPSAVLRRAEFFASRPGRTRGDPGRADDPRDDTYDQRSPKTTSMLAIFAYMDPLGSISKPSALWKTAWTACCRRFLLVCSRLFSQIAPFQDASKGKGTDLETASIE